MERSDRCIWKESWIQHSFSNSAGRSISGTEHPAPEESRHLCQELKSHDQPFIGSVGGGGRGVAWDMMGDT